MPNNYRYIVSVPVSIEEGKKYDNLSHQQKLTLFSIIGEEYREVLELGEGGRCLSGMFWMHGGSEHAQFPKLLTSLEAFFQRDLGPLKFKAAGWDERVWHKFYWRRLPMKDPFAAVVKDLGEGEIWVKDPEAKVYVPRVAMLHPGYHGCITTERM